MVYYQNETFTYYLTLIDYRCPLLMAIHNDNPSKNKYANLSRASLSYNYLHTNSLVTTPVTPPPQPPLRNYRPRYPGPPTNSCSEPSPNSWIILGKK